MHDALEGYIINENEYMVRNRAIKAYARYQNIYEKEAGEILVTGWE